MCDGCGTAKKNSGEKNWGGEWGLIDEGLPYTGSSSRDGRKDRQAIPLTGGEARRYQ